MKSAFENPWLMVSATALVSATAFLAFLLWNEERVKREMRAQCKLYGVHWVWGTVQEVGVIQHPVDPCTRQRLD